MTWSLAIHGGAGLIRRDPGPAERYAPARAALNRALDAGAELLTRGAPALDAVCAAVRVMEDAPCFNAGRGGVLAADGTVQCDASVMRGADRATGALAAVRGIANPILGAREVMAHSPHVLLAGHDAEAWLRARGLATRAPDWFITPERAEHLARAQRAGRTALDHDLEDNATGTVGAVARDVAGSLAAATSTGGMTNKLPGRVGDSALVGAGTWACDSTVAVSATGEGERFIQAHLAGRMHDLMDLLGLSLQDAATRALQVDLRRVGGRGGLIAVDAQGRIGLPFITAGMYRGWATSVGPRGVGIWPEDGSPWPIG